MPGADFIQNCRGSNARSYATLLEKIAHEMRRKVE